MRSLTLNHNGHIIFNEMIGKGRGGTRNFRWKGMYNCPRVRNNIKMTNMVNCLNHEQWTGFR